MEYTHNLFNNSSSSSNYSSSNCSSSSSNNNKISKSNNTSKCNNNNKNRSITIYSNNLTKIRFTLKNLRQHNQIINKIFP